MAATASGAIDAPQPVQKRPPSASFPQWLQNAISAQGYAFRRHRARPFATGIVVIRGSSVQTLRCFNLFLTMQCKCGHYNSAMPDAPLRVETLPSSVAVCRVLKLDGPLTLSNFFEFQSLVRSDSTTCLIVDASGVPYIDSAGIGCLVNGYVSHQNAGKSLCLVGVTDRVRTSLRVANVEQFFPIFSSLAEADQYVANRSG